MYKLEELPESKEMAVTTVDPQHEGESPQHKQRQGPPTRSHEGGVPATDPESTHTQPGDGSRSRRYDEAPGETTGVDSTNMCGKYLGPKSQSDAIPQTIGHRTRPQWHLPTAVTTPYTQQKDTTNRQTARSGCADVSISTVLKPNQPHP